MRLLAAFLAILSTLAHTPQASRIRWQWLRGPLYAPAQSVIAHQGRLLITTPFVAWVSADEGRTWQRPSPPLATARQLAVADRDLYRDDVTGIQRSSDAGGTWTTCGALPIDRRTGHEATSLRAQGQHVYVSVQRTGVFGSADRCRTWKKLALPAPSDATPLVSFARGDRVIVRGATGSFLSNDAGGTWASIEAAAPDALTFEPYCDSMLLAGTGRGLRVSRDQGRTWMSAGLDGRWVPAVTSPTCGTIYAAVKDEQRWTYSVMRSLDDGKSWSPHHAGLPPHPVYTLTSADKENVYAAGAGGVYRSSRGGGWEQVGPPDRAVVAVAAAPWNAVLAAADDALYSMAQDRSGWRMLLLGHEAHLTEDRPMVSATALAVTTGGDIFAGGRYGILRSTDRGETWRRSGLPQTVTAVAATADRTLLAGTRTGVFQSADGGETWVHRPLLTAQPEVLALSVAADGAIFAATRGGEIFRSTTGGERWVPVGAVPGAVHALLATRSGAVFAGNDFGVFQWRPQDNVWLPLAPAEPRSALLKIRALVQHPGGAVIAASDGQGIFVSGDEGRSWSRANDGLSVAGVLSLAVGPDGRLYAGTAEGAFEGSM